MKSIIKLHCIDPQRVIELTGQHLLIMLLKLYCHIVHFFFVRSYRVVRLSDYHETRVLLPMHGFLQHFNMTITGLGLPTDNGSLFVPAIISEKSSNRLTAAAIVVVNSLLQIIGREEACKPMN